MFFFSRPNLAPILGPILGGALAEHPGWPWIFWLLTIFSGVCLIALFLSLPETARVIVGSGGLPAHGFVANLCSGKGQEKGLHELSNNSTVFERLHFPNPLKCLTLLSRKDIFMIVTINGIFYASYCCVQASLGLLFIEIYGFREIQAGLIYLPFGCGCVLASIVSGWCYPSTTLEALLIRPGKIMDRDYHTVARAHNFPVDRVNGDDLTRFRIERARLRSSWYFLVLTVVSTGGYGWTLAYKTVSSRQK